MLNVAWCSAVEWVELDDGRGHTLRLTRADMPGMRGESRRVALGGVDVGTVRRIKRRGTGGALLTVAFDVDRSVVIVRSNARPRGVAT